MAYTKTAWVNGGAPAISAANLNKIESGIENAIGLDTLSDLRALAVPTAIFTAQILGHTNDGDGGGGLFWWDSASSAADNGGTIIIPNSTPANGRWKRIYSGMLDVRWFGAKGDGTTDDRAAIQAAIDAHSGTVLLPPGNYLINSGISWNKSNIRLTGAGEGSTTITCGFAGGDIIRVGDGTANPNNVLIEHLSITSSVSKTSGAAIRYRNGHNLKISHVRLDNNLYWGIQFDGGAEQFLYYLDHFEINNGVIGIVVGEDGTLVQDIWIDTGIVAGGVTTDGIVLKHVSGFYFRDIDLLGCGQSGISTFPDTGKKVVAGWCDTVIADTCDSHGWNIITNGGQVAELTLSSCWGAGCGVVDNGHGMFFNTASGSIKGISITSPRCINNKGSGIVIESAEDISISNPQCLSNSQQGSAVKHGIEIGPGVVQFSIDGGVCGQGGQFSVNNQGYGILINAGTSNDYSITNVNLLGNVTGGLSDGGSGSTKHISGNIGYRTAAQGEFELGSAATSISVNHTLAATPAKKDIQITPLSAWGSATKWWISAADATTFTLSVDVAPGVSVFFGWSARIKGA